MSPVVFAWAFAPFVLLLVCHAVIYRLYQPSSEDKFVFGLYVIFPLIVFAGLLLLGLMGWFDLGTLIPGYFLYFVVSAAWVASYPAIYADCPTLIIAYVADRSSSGVTLEELRVLLNLKKNSNDRIEDAIRGKLIRMKGQLVELTPQGRVFYLFFATYRRIIGRRLETL